MTTETKTTTAFVLGLVVIIGWGALSLQSIHRQIEANRWITHTHQVLENLEDVLSALTDAETGQRGFILTGEERYLEPYTSATGIIRQKLDAVVDLTKDNPTQQQSIEQVRKLSGDELAELQETIQARRQGGLQAALPIILTDRGKRIMDDLRRLVGRMERREQDLLEVRTQRAEASTWHMTWTMVLWMPGALLILAVAVVAMTRKTRLTGAGEPADTPHRLWDSLIVRYGSAVIILAVAAALRWRLAQSFGPLPPFITFFPAILLVASLGGGGPGILATVLAALAAQYWFFPPFGSFRVDAPNDVLALGIFTASGFFLSVLAERLRRGRWVEAFAAAQQQHAERLSQQNDELQRQSEELSQQAEELSQQAEELSGQNEELQAQSEEIQDLNTELAHREALLQALLDEARLVRSEKAAMQEVCAAALHMFGEAAAVMVCEKQQERLTVRAIAAADAIETPPELLPLGHSFTELIMRQSRTAAINDTSLRPDLQILRVPGMKPFQAVLCAPLLTDGSAVGAVAIYSYRKQEWTDEQFHLAEWLAGQCAHILETLRMQQDLRRQAALIDLSPDGIMVRRLDGTITHWGHGAETLYGWSKAEAVGRTTHALLKTQFPEALDGINRRLRETGQWTGELVHTTKGGRQVVVESRWLAERDDKGNIVELLESNVDLTERKQAELEREITVELLRLVNESTATQDLVASALTFFQQRSGCEAVGLRLREGDDFPYFEARGFPAEFVQLENSLCTRDLAGQLVRDSAGDPVIDCMCGNVICGRFDPAKPFFTSQGSFWTNNTTRLLASTTEVDRQAPTRNRCNGQGYESVALVPLAIGAERLGLLQFNDRRPGMFSAAKIHHWERLAGYLAVALAKLQAEQQNTRLATFPLLNPNPIVEADLDGRVCYANPAAERILPDIQIRGIDHPWLAEWPAVAALCRSGEELPAREVVVGDRCFHQTLYFMPHSARVRTYGLDITDRKRSEQALRATAEELQRSNHELEQFAYISSHDLQEPLRQVRSFVQLLRERYQEKLDERGTEYMRFIVEGAARMSDLVQDLLNYSRVGAREKRRHSVSCEGALAKALANLQVAIAESGARVTHEDLPTVTADPTQLAQLFQNLAGNAIKFRREGVAPEIHVGARREGPNWLLWIKDNGIGIDPQYGDKVFQIFQRLHTRDKYPGTGIGLAICKKIVEQHGGRIWVESQSGAGTTVLFTLGEENA